MAHSVAVVKREQGRNRSQGEGFDDPASGNHACADDQQVFVRMDAVCCLARVTDNLEINPLCPEPFKGIFQGCGNAIHQNNDMGRTAGPRDADLVFNERLTRHWHERPRIAFGSECVVIGQYQASQWQGCALPRRNSKGAIGRSCRFEKPGPSGGYDIDSPADPSQSHGIARCGLQRQIGRLNQGNGSETRSEPFETMGS